MAAPAPGYHRLTGRFEHGDGSPRGGHLRFTPTTTVVGDQVIVLPAPLTVPLVNGSFTVDLAGTDEPVWSPPGWLWTVTEMLDGGRADYSFELTENADLSSLVVVVPPADYDTLVPVARQITAGAGLTGGGTLAADRTLTVGAGTGIAVGADDVSVVYGSTAGTAAEGSALTAEAAARAAGDAAAQAAAEATAAAALGVHTADTTAVHGIADTAALVLTGDARLSDARTPTAHAASHAAAGSDPVTLAQSQVTNLTAALALKAPLASPTFTGVPTAPTAAQGTATTQVATTAHVAAAIIGAAIGELPMPAGSIVKADTENNPAALTVPASTIVGRASTGDIAALTLTQLRSMIGARRCGPMGALHRALDVASESCALVVLGDSTGNETTEWVYLFASTLAARYPGWTVEHRLWNDSAQSYDAPTTIQAGTGGVRGVTTTTESIYDAGDGTSVVGDLDVRVKVTLADWTPAVTGVFAARFGNAPLRGWRFLLDPTGYISMDWSTDGTNLQSAASSGVATGFADGATGWVRFVLDVDNGSTQHTVKFYKSTDGVTWTQLGSTVTRAGVTSVYAPARQYELGARGDSGQPLAGTYHAVEIRNGVDGLSVVPYHPDRWLKITAATVTVTGAPVLTVLNGSTPGAAQSYFTDTTRQTKMVPYSHRAIALVMSCSHNETRTKGLNYWATWDTWLAAIRTRLAPVGAVSWSTQNPQVSPALWVREHAVRQSEGVAWAARNGLGLIDAYRAFMEDGRTLSGTLVSASDGVHLLTAGSEVWRDAALLAFDNFE